MSGRRRATTPGRPGRAGPRLDDAGNGAGTGGRWDAALASLRARGASVARVLRQVIGAPDYERYLQHHARAHAGTPPLRRREFYADFVSARFGSGASRCC